jgi:hypothetical protein
MVPCLGIEPSELARRIYSPTPVPAVKAYVIIKITATVDTVTNARITTNRTSRLGTSSLFSFILSSVAKSRIELATSVLQTDALPTKLHSPGTRGRS